MTGMTGISRLVLLAWWHSRPVIGANAASSTPYQALERWHWHSNSSSEVQYWLLDYYNTSQTLYLTMKVGWGLVIMRTTFPSLPLESWRTILLLMEYAHGTAVCLHLLVVIVQAWDYYAFFLTIPWFPYYSPHKTPIILKLCLKNRTNFSGNYTVT